MALRVMAREGASVHVQRLCRGHLGRLKALHKRLEKEEEQGMKRRAALRKIRALATKENRCVCVCFFFFY
jgi:hypothetical protein